MVTCIRNVNWAVVWDGGQQYRRDIDIAFDGGRITHVGPGYAGTVYGEIDGRDRMVVRDRQVVTLDYHDAARKLHQAGLLAERHVGERHYAGQSARQVSPLTLPGLD